MLFVLQNFLQIHNLNPTQNPHFTAKYSSFEVVIFETTYIVLIKLVIAIYCSLFIISDLSLYKLVEKSFSINVHQMSFIK